MTNSTEHILFYRKSDAVDILKESRSEEHQNSYSNPDNDYRGVWTSVSFVNQVTREARPNLSYTIKNPNTDDIINHPTNAWKVSKEKYELLQNENRLHWGADGKAKYPRIKRFLSELDDGMVPVNLWKFKEAGTADMGTKEIKNLMGINAFTFPKPPLLIRKMLSLFNPKDTKSNKDEIILDFFAGSGTTAHAILEQNKEDDGNRKFICVQWAEETSENSEAKKAGYETIFDITQERIKRAGDKIVKVILVLELLK
jgi:adenine-specific DNA-methyltransferase